MERVVQPGEFYQHFKNKLYQIITVASDSETGAPMVVYQALYGTYTTYVRPLAMFLSEVDHEKYPDCQQTYRFQRVNLNGAKGQPEACSDESSTSFGNEEKASDHLLRFLDAPSVDRQLEILDMMKGKVTAGEVESICMVLGISNLPGSIEQQLDAIKKTLKTKQRYDGSRLRERRDDIYTVFGGKEGGGRV